MPRVVSAGLVGDVARFEPSTSAYRRSKALMKFQVLGALSISLRFIRISLSFIDLLHLTTRSLMALIPISQIISENVEARINTNADLKLTKMSSSPRRNTPQIAVKRPTGESGTDAHANSDCASSLLRNATELTRIEIPIAVKNEGEAPCHTTASNVSSKPQIEETNRMAPWSGPRSTKNTKLPATYSGSPSPLIELFWHIQPNAYRNLKRTNVVDP
jgi:hypothetical protein